MIDFDLLAKNNCFLIDGTTVRFVSGNDGRTFLAEAPPLRELDRREYMVQNNEWCRKSLELLGLLVLYDSAVVDSFALEISSRDVVDASLIQITSFPDSVVTDCGLELGRSLSSLYGQSDANELSWLSDDSTNYELFEMPDKSWVDDLSSRDKVIIPSVVTDSNNSPVRALFYLELADRAGIPLLLSPQKDKCVTTYREKLRKFAHELVVAKVETQFQSKLDEQIKSLFARTWSVSLPPVSRMILRRAREELRPLLDVAKEIRDSTEARSFRKYLAELNKTLASGYEAGLLNVQAKLNKLESLVDGWFETGDINQGVTYKRRKFNIGEIPTIGWIAKMAGIGSFSVNDPILNPNRVYRFISQWYSAE